MKMLKVDAMGDACPIPVVKTKNAIKELNGAGELLVLVDNEIAVQNLMKMAEQKKYMAKSEKIAENQFQVSILISEEIDGACTNKREEEGKQTKSSRNSEKTVCIPDSRKNKIVVCSSNKMGSGNEELGTVLMKAFFYALSQQEELPKLMLFYNSGVFLTSQPSSMLEDLKSLEAQGVEILSCGTCLNYYGLTDSLQVGTVTNMYDIVDRMSQAQIVIRP